MKVAAGLKETALLSLWVWYMVNPCQIPSELQVAYVEICCFQISESGPVFAAVLWILVVSIDEELNESI